MRLCTLGAVFGAYLVINARHANAPFMSVIPLTTAGPLTFITRTSSIVCQLHHPRQQKLQILEKIRLDSRGKQIKAVSVNILAKSTRCTIRVHCPRPRCTRCTISPHRVPGVTTHQFLFAAGQLAQVWAQLSCAIGTRTSMPRWALGFAPWLLSVLVKQYPHFKMFGMKDLLSEGLLQLLHRHLKAVSFPRAHNGADNITESSPARCRWC